MTKRVFIVHGWDGFPDEGWFPWLKNKLSNSGFQVNILPMPNPKTPEINAWVSTLNTAVGIPDEDTFFVGHSIGCQTILRYLETLNKDLDVGGIVLVAAWTKLTPEATPDETSVSIAKPWTDTPIKWDVVRSHSHNFVAVYSDNDPWVEITESKLFQDKLGAQIITEHNKGHFSGDDKVTELPVVFDKIMSFS